MNSKLLTSLICLSLAGSLAVFADSERVESTAEGEHVYYTYDEPTEKQPVVAKEETPAPVVASVAEPLRADTTVISSQEMETRHDVTVSDALRKVNGVTLNEINPGTAAYIYLNGTDRVLVRVDGVDVSDNHGSGHGRSMVNLENLPTPSAIDHIEVTRGAGSVTNGSGAVGGVINIITKKGDVNKSTLDVNTGSWGSHNYTITNQGKSGDTSWNVSGSLGHRKYMKFDDGYKTDEVGSDFSKKNFNARIDQKIDDANSVTFHAAHYNWHGHNTSFYDPIDGKFAPYEKSNRQTELNNDYDITYRFNEDKDMGGFLRYYNNYSRTQRDSYTPPTSKRSKKSSPWKNYDWNTRTQGVQLENGWHTGIHHIKAGFDWMEDKGENKGIYTEKRRTNRAAYIEDAIDYGKWTFTPGARIDDNSQFGVFRTPRLNIDYKASDTFKAYANWGRVFEAPNLNDLFYNLATSKGNPDLKPETGYTQSIGFIWQADKKTTFDVNLFRSSLSNAIRWNKVDAIRHVENLNKEKKRGIELTMNHVINDDWDYMLGYSYTHTKIDEATGLGMVLDTMYNRPNGYRAGLHYHHKAWQASVDLTAGTGRNDYYYSNNSYVVWDAAVSYDMDDHTTWYAKVNNLTDEGYDLFHDYPAAGRFYQFGVKYTF